MADAGRADDEPPRFNLVDWDLAVNTAYRLIRPGPDVSRDQAQQVVGELRESARAAEPYVRGYTSMDGGPGTAPVMVVDRRGWVRANADGLRDLMAPLLVKIQQSRGAPGQVTSAIGSRLTGLEAGGLLAFLSNKVLGQFDPYHLGSVGPGGRQVGGRLLLVAPNVVHVERELDVDPHDFRLWICLHEETHRVQFTAVPWLRQHILDQISTLIESADLDPSRFAALIREAAERVGRLARGETDVSILDALQTPEQKAVIEHLTAVMSLLEGHADVVMDGVGPDVVRTVDAIRAKFQQRRAGAGPLDQFFRRVLGLDAKLRQYRDGASFVRRVLDQVGMDGFNAIWADPASLPTKDEIADPRLWVGRIHG